MKKADYKTSLCQAFTALAFIGTLSACVEEDVADNVWKPKGEELVVLPAVSESPVQRVATRAASVEELKEKELNTLDVFVQRVGEDTLMKQYHLPLLADQNIVESNLNWLADRWRKEGLVMGEQYNIYVAANNPKTNTDVDGVDALKALTYSEVEDNVAVVNETSNNITWGTDGTSGNIYKLYAETPGDYRALTSEKQFMMDGVINNWTPNPSTLTQEFDVTLNRAAAKIVVNVNFDADFLKSLTKDKDGKEKADKDKLFITGSPAWRFYNFAFGAPVFDPGTNFTPVEVHNSDFNIFHNQPFEGDDKHFQIVTYTYPNKWDEANYATAAPSLVISVPFSQYKNIGADGHHTDDEMTTTYNYFRIPIVAHTTTSVDRNHIYVVNATLATRGSMSLEDEDVIEDVVYNVLPWNDESNSAVIKNEVEAVQHYYLKVNPKVYTLRGDGQQSVDINYLKAAGTSVKWQLYSFDTTTQTKGAAVEPTANNAVWGWYYDGDGDMKTSYSGMIHMGVTINQSSEGTSGSSGKITVTSTDLPNRAIKYMLLRVYLNEKQTLYEDVIIRHFPTDNIQNIKSLWSSRTSSGWWKYSNGTGNNASGYKNDEEAGYSGESNLFRAKYYRNGSIYGYGRQSAYSNSSWYDIGLDNISKYIIQISSTSDQYVMGRPYLNGYKQSNDHVVSPAFMIASQLGATSSKSPGYYNGYYYDLENEIPTYARAAANHCNTYKEVDSDGREWTGWRLPTREEVGVILRYQHARYDTMDPVLTGQFYWTLEGEAVATGVLSQNNNGTYNWATNWDSRYSDSSYDYPGRNGDGVSNRNCYIRCIRDMSASEIESLNGFEEIIDQYQNK